MPVRSWRAVIVSLLVVAAAVPVLAGWPRVATDVTALAAMTTGDTALAGTAGLVTGGIGGGAAAPGRATARAGSSRTGADTPIRLPAVPGAPDVAQDLVVPTVGALFDPSSGGHFCTASVVDSPHGNLLITAAHCVDGWQGNGRALPVFVPGYHDGQRPYGSWQVTAITVDPRWSNSADEDRDVAFLTVAPAGGQQIADVVGANRLGIDLAPGAPVRVVGYPSASEQPLLCADVTKQESAHQIRMDCPGYTGGTSGGPWLANFDPQTLTGDVVGVIGGYQEGGDTADISYSASFDDDVQTLHDVAADN